MTFEPANMDELRKTWLVMQYVCKASWITAEIHRDGENCHCILTYIFTDLTVYMFAPVMSVLNSCSLAVSPTALLMLTQVRRVWTGLSVHTPKRKSKTTCPRPTRRESATLRWNLPFLPPCANSAIYEVELLLDTRAHWIRCTLIWMNENYRKWLILAARYDTSW